MPEAFSGESEIQRVAGTEYGWYQSSVENLKDDAEDFRLGKNEVLSEAEFSLITSKLNRVVDNAAFVTAELAKQGLEDEAKNFIAWARKEVKKALKPLEQGYAEVKVKRKIKEDVYDADGNVTEVEREIVENKRFLFKNLRLHSYVELRLNYEKNAAGVKRKTTAPGAAPLPQDELRELQRDYLALEQHPANFMMPKVAKMTQDARARAGGAVNVEMSQDPATSLATMRTPQELFSLRKLLSEEGKDVRWLASVNTLATYLNAATNFKNSPPQKEFYNQIETNVTNVKNLHEALKNLNAIATDPAVFANYPDLSADRVNELLLVTEKILNRDFDENIVAYQKFIKQMRVYQFNKDKGETYDTYLRRAKQRADAAQASLTPELYEQLLTKMNQNIDQIIDHLKLQSDNLGNVRYEDPNNTGYNKYFQETIRSFINKELGEVSKVKSSLGLGSGTETGVVNSARLKELKALEPAPESLNSDWEYYYTNHFLTERDLVRYEVKIRIKDLVLSNKRSTEKDDEFKGYQRFLGLYNALKNSGDTDYQKLANEMEHWRLTADMALVHGESRSMLTETDNLKSEMGQGFQIHVLDYWFALDKHGHPAKVHDKDGNYLSEGYENAAQVDAAIQMIVKQLRTNPEFSKRWTDSDYSRDEMKRVVTNEMSAKYGNSFVEETVHIAYMVCTLGSARLHTFADNPTNAYAFGASPPGDIVAKRKYLDECHPLAKMLYSSYKKVRWMPVAPFLKVPDAWWKSREGVANKNRLKNMKAAERGSWMAISRIAPLRKRREALLTKDGDLAHPYPSSWDFVYARAAERREQRLSFKSWTDGREGFKKFEHTALGEVPGPGKLDVTKSEDRAKYRDILVESIGALTELYGALKANPMLDWHEIADMTVEYIDKVFRAYAEFALQKDEKGKFKIHPIASTAALIAQAEAGMADTHTASKVSGLIFGDSLFALIKKQLRVEWRGNLDSCGNLPGGNFEIHDNSAYYEYKRTGHYHEHKPKEVNFGDYVDNKIQLVNRWLPPFLSEHPRRILPSTKFRLLQNLRYWYQFGSKRTDYPYFNKSVRMTGSSEKELKATGDEKDH
jgi:hypothetical protein